MAADHLTPADLPSLTPRPPPFAHSLSEYMAFKNIFFAAGAIPPLLSLLVHPVQSVAVTAACAISCLCDAGLSSEQLAQEPALVALLRALQVVQAVEVNIGVLYTLNRLATNKPSVAGCLRARGAPQLLLRLMQRWQEQDSDLALGVAQLLQTLGVSAVPSSASSMESSVLSTLTTGGSSLDEIHSPPSFSSASTGTQPTVGPLLAPLGHQGPVSACAAGAGAAAHQVAIPVLASAAEGPVLGPAGAPGSSSTSSSASSAAFAELREQLQAGMRAMAHKGSRLAAASAAAAGGAGPLAAPDASVIVEHVAC